MIAAVLTTSTIAAACGGGGAQQDNGGSNTPATSAAAPAAGTQAQDVDITFKSEPDPPKMGENTLEVMVMADGKPVTDADVAVEFYMPAMPAMNMAEMRNSVPLKHDSEGRYRGTGNVMMSGNWDATVRVRRGGQEIGSEKFPITAK
jgi:hypothetical protein